MDQEQRSIYSVQMTAADRAALEAVAQRWQVKRSDVVRIAIRVLAEVTEASARPPTAPRAAEATATAGSGEVQ